MTRAILARDLLAAGEVTPRILARYNIAQHQAGLYQALNGLALPHGGFRRRSGFRFVAPTKNPADNVALLPFERQSVQSYCLELGQEYMRFYTEGGQLLNAAGTAPFEVQTPYSAAEVDDVQIAQSSDAAYLVHRNHEPYKLTFVNANLFTFLPVDFSAGRMPIGPINSNPDATILNESGTTFERRLTAGVPTFVSGDVGRTFFFQELDEGTAFVIVRQLVSSTVIEVDYLYRDPDDVNPADNAATATDFWAWGLFGETEGCNAVEFHEGRLVYGGFKNQPDYLALSVSGTFDSFDFSSFDSELTDADNADKAIFRRVVSRTSNVVQWLRSSNKTLVVGASGAEFPVSSGNDSILTPASTVIRPGTTRGSSLIAPAVVENEAVFLDRSRTKLTQFSFDISTDNFAAPEISILAEHLLRESRAKRLAYQRSPDSVLWVLRDNGTFAAWTLEREQEIRGAHRHIMGGSFLGGNAQVLSAVVLPGSSGASGDEAITGLELGTEADAGSNLSFDAGDLTGWTTVSGSWSAQTDVAGLLPQSGSHFVIENSSAVDPEINQTIALTAFAGLNTQLVDRGVTTIQLQFSYAANTDTKSVQVILEALDTAGVVIQTIYDSGALQPPVANEWQLVDTGQLTFARTARQFRIRLINPDLTGSLVAFDAITFQVRQFDLPALNPIQEVEDQLWVVTRRTINGGTKQYVEVSEKSFAPALPRSATDREKALALESARLHDSFVVREAPQAISSISSADPTVITTTDDHGLTVGDRVRIRGASGLDPRWRTEFSDVTYLVSSVPTSTTFTVSDLATGDDIGTSDYDAWLNDGQSMLHTEVQMLTGADHLAGQTVSVFADGTDKGDATVGLDGSVTLPNDAWGSIISVGLNYDTVLETFPFIVDLGKGPLADSTYQFSWLTSYMYNTVGGKYGRGPNPSEDDLETFVDGPADAPLGFPYPIFSGSAEIRLMGSSTTDDTIYIKQDRPLPLEILGLFIRADVNSS